MEVFVSEYGLYLSYLLFAVGVVAAIVLPLIKALDEPKKLVQAGIGLAALLVIFLISWAIAGNEVTSMYTEKGVDVGLSKLVGGMLTMVYLLMGIAVVGIVYTEITKAVK